PTPTPTPTVSGYTRAEVSQRNTATNCWTIINESIYDLTSWINSHPGGPSAIRSLCGADGTTSFSGMHGNASDPMRELNRRYVGKLKS
ncbi:MAG: cytochrome b5 domain-containing protein, partial [Actinomycetota bacterium]